MKQRLGLAIELVGQPRLLILDEPTNGLDPDGMREFRELIHQVAKEEAVAVFISSHLLAEVEQICERVIFIEDGTIKAIESMAGIQKSQSYFIELPLSAEHEKLIREMNYLNLLDVSERGCRVGLAVEPQEALRRLVTAGLPIRSFAPVQRDLQERYHEVVRGGIR